MDWDHITANDILAIFTSFCKGDMVISKVEIFPSLYGLEQMKNDSLYGPPQRLFDDEQKDKKAISKKKKEVKSKEETNDFIDEADIENEGFHSQ